MKDAIAEVVRELRSVSRKHMPTALEYLAKTKDWADRIEAATSSTPARALSEGELKALEHAEHCCANEARLRLSKDGPFATVCATARRLAAGGLDSESRRLRAAEALEWVNDCSDSDLELIFAHSPMLAKRLAEKLATPSASVAALMCPFCVGGTLKDGRCVLCHAWGVPSASVGGEVEPVAWGVVYNGKVRDATTSRSRAESMEGDEPRDGRDIEHAYLIPLYAKPPALVVDDEMVERARKAWDAHEYTEHAGDNGAMRAALIAALAKEAPRG